MEVALLSVYTASTANYASTAFTADTAYTACTALNACTVAYMPTYVATPVFFYSFTNMAILLFLDFGATRGEDLTG